MSVRSQKIKMSLGEFEVMPWKWGWKYEYADGHALIYPRENFVVVRAEVAPRLIVLPCDDHDMHLQGVGVNNYPADEKRLVSAFIDAFAETAEFCDYEYTQLETAAWKTVNGFFTGKRGEVNLASRLAIVPDEYFPVVGAAFVVTKTDGPVLDTLFVRREWQRRGLGTALVAGAMSELHKVGARFLRSAHHIANEASAEWHRRFGFVEEPDLFVAKLRYNWARHEIFRKKRLGDLSDIYHLESECHTLLDQVKALEMVAERDGYEAVVPILRYA
jgi:GNAT superfamily N-acetyltransferase